MPSETLALLLGLEFPAQFIFGNGEVAVLQCLDGQEPSKVSEMHREPIRWTARKLSPEHREMLRGWPKTIQLQIPGLGPALFCHATPRDEDEIFTELTAEHLLLPVFQDLDAALVVCGHTHMQFDRMIGKIRVVNAGSVGMPFGKPGADWLLLGPGVELRHTNYDLEKAAGRIRATDYPGADEFAARCVLETPPAGQMLAAFTNAHFK